DGLAVEANGGRAVEQGEQRGGGLVGELARRRLVTLLRRERRGEQAGEDRRGDGGDGSGHACAHRSIPSRFMRRYRLGRSVRRRRAASAMLPPAAASASRIRRRS